MALATKIKLEINTPVRGTLKYVDWYAEKERDGKMMPSQWGLTGSWEVFSAAHQAWLPAVEAKIYMDEFQLASSPVTLGLAENKGDRDGVPQFRVAYTGQVQILKREDGRKRIITISRVGDALETTERTIQHVPPVTAPPRAPIAPPRGYTTGTKTLQEAAQPIGGDPWVAMEARYARCAAMAHRCWGSWGMADPVALVAATATLFIEANKEHLVVPATDPAFTVTSGGSPQVAVSVSGAIPAPIRHDGHATEEQVKQFRTALASEVFSTGERQEWLQKLYGATVASLASDIARLQQMIRTRTAPAGAGPGMPGRFDDFPPALEPTEDDLPF